MRSDEWVVVKLEMLLFINTDLEGLCQGTIPDFA